MLSAKSDPNLLTHLKTTYNQVVVKTCDAIGVNPDDARSAFRVTRAITTFTGTSSTRLFLVVAIGAFRRDGFFFSFGQRKTSEVLKTRRSYLQPASCNNPQNPVIY